MESAETSFREGVKWALTNDYYAAIGSNGPCKPQGGVKGGVRRAAAAAGNMAAAAADLGAYSVGPVDTAWAKNNLLFFAVVFVGGLLFNRYQERVIHRIPAALAVGGVTVFSGIPAAVVLASGEGVLMQRGN